MIITWRENLRIKTFGKTVFIIYKEQLVYNKLECRKPKTTNKLYCLQQSVFYNFESGERIDTKDFL